MTPLHAFLGLCVLALALGDSTDFKVYYQAAERWTAVGWGGVYDAGALTPFKYHPLTVYLFLPFTLLPFGAAKVAWALLNGACLFDFRRRAMAAFPATSRDVLWGFFFALHAITWELKFANITFLMLWLLFWAATSKRDWSRATAIALLIFFKPTWLILPALLLYSGAYPLLGRVCALLALSSVVLWVVGGNACYALWWQTLSDPLHAHNYPKNDNQSWFAFCFRAREWMGETLPWIVGSLAFLGVYLWKSWPYRRQVNAVLLSGVLPWLWIAPLSWIHHQLLLIPFFIALISGMKRIPFRWEGIAMILVWFALNGTGELFMGRERFTTVHQASVPLLGFLALLALVPAFYRRAEQLDAVQA